MDRDYIWPARMDILEALPEELRPHTEKIKKVLEEIPDTFPNVNRSHIYLGIFLAPHLFTVRVFQVLSWPVFYDLVVDQDGDGDLA